MKLKNKKTGEIVDLSEGFIRDTYCGEMIQIKPVAISNKEGYVYGSLAELNEEWEDAPEEQGEYWCIDWTEIGGIYRNKYEDELDDFNKQIGNYFETKEEAELALEKLKAWKFLKDIGFKIEGIRYRDHKSYIEWSISQKVRDDHFTSEAFNDALHLLFGGEE